MKSEEVTLVLLPGLNGTEGLFTPLRNISPKKFKILCISYPTHEQKSYLELAAYVSNKLKEVKGNYLLLGESFSGPVAILVSQSNPIGLLGTILVATFISAPNLKIGRRLPWHLLFSLAKPLFKVKQLIKPQGQPLSTFDTALLEIQQCSSRVLAARIKEIFELDCSEELASCSIPMMYLRGNSDWVVPARNLEKILKIRPDIAVASFNTNHFLLQSSPIEAWQAINSFNDTVSNRIL